jgi:predicted permease
MALALSVVADLRLAVRSLARNGSFAVLAILALALGLGANTAAFSAFDAVFARDLPVRNPEELVTFHWLRTSNSMVAAYSGYGRQGPGGMGIRTSFSPVTLERFRAASHTLSHVFAFADRLTMTVTADGVSEAASAQVVSGNYYVALGVPAIHGRLLTEADDSAGAPAVAVMTYRYWQRRFGGNPVVIGQPLVINGSPVVIVGVTPEGFDGTLATETSDLTLPLAQAGLAQANGRPRPRSTWSLRIMGRLKPGASLEQVEPDLRGVFEASVHEAWAMRPADTPNPSRSEIPALRTMSGRQGPDGPRRDALADLAVALAVGGAILVIGSANVANLVMIRGLKRRREIAIRLALGASRGRVIRLLLAECVVLALAGATLGVILAGWGKDFLTWLPTSSAPIVTPAIDGRVVAFAAALAALTAMSFGLVPALRATRSQLAMDMKRRGWRRLAGHTMVVVQIAVCVVLLTAAGLAFRTVRNLSMVDVGFETDNLIVFRLAAAGDAAPRTPSAHDELADAIAAVPGVAAATFSAMPLVANSVWTETVQSDDGSTAHEVHFQVVRSNFIRTVGMRVMAGRDFSAADRRGSALVALVNQRMVREVFGDVSPVGRYVRLQTGSPRDVPIEVIGVVSDAKYAAVDADAPATLYRPASQSSLSAVTFEVRTATEPAALISAIRDVVGRTVPGVAMTAVKTQRQQIDETVARPRSLAAVTAIFGIVAVLLACLGIYGVVSYDISQRITELAIRVALGASPGQVLGVVGRNVMAIVAIGGLAGGAIVLSAIPVARQFVYGVSPSDPVTFAAVMATLTLAALAAALPPAWQATKVSPVDGLKRD